jgi:hypothetical protein
MLADRECNAFRTTVDGAKRRLDRRHGACPYCVAMNGPVHSAKWWWRPSQEWVRGTAG